MRGRETRRELRRLRADARHFEHRAQEAREAGDHALAAAASSLAADRYAACVTLLTHAKSFWV